MSNMADVIFRVTLVPFEHPFSLQSPWTFSQTECPTVHCLRNRPTWSSRWVDPGAERHKSNETAYRPNTPALLCTPLLPNSEHKRRPVLGCLWKSSTTLYQEAVLSVFSFYYLLT